VGSPDSTDVENATPTSDAAGEPTTPGTSPAPDTTGLANSDAVTLAPVTAAPGEATCVVSLINFLDHPQVTFDLVGSGPPSIPEVEFAVTFDGETFQESARLSLVRDGELARLRYETNTDVPATTPLEAFSCEVLNFSLSPREELLPVEAECEVTEVDEADWARTVVTADLTELDRSGGEPFLAKFSLVLSDGNGVRITDIIEEVALPADGSEATLGVWTTFAKSRRDNWPYQLADFDLQCGAFAFFLGEETLDSADPAATCAVENVSADGIVTMSLEAVVEDGTDVWFAMTGPDGTWLETDWTYVTDDEPRTEFEFDVAGPIDGLDIGELGCEVVGQQEAF
jgi:hypothetical protein